MRCEIFSSPRNFFRPRENLRKKVWTDAINSVQKSSKSEPSSRFLSLLKIENTLATFGRIQPIVPGFVRIIIRFAYILGRLAELAQKWHVNFQNLKRLKHREDGSDFDDFWMESIASAQTFFCKIFPRTKKNRGDEKISRRTNNRTNEVPELVRYTP